VILTVLSTVFYYSNDGAASFSSIELNLSNIPSYAKSLPELKAVFGQQGHLWLANQENGQFRSTDGGQSWTEISTSTALIK
jgi:hypothetical protein